MKVIFSFLLVGVSIYGSAQKEFIEYQPYIDNQYFHLGFHLGLNLQDIFLVQKEENNTEKWAAVIPDYKVGFNAGVIADFYLSRFFESTCYSYCLFRKKRVSF